MPDIPLALEQHDAYCEVLRSCGMDVIVLEEIQEFPDSTFVEDAAVIAGRTAVITRPGHPSRLGETELIEPILSRFLDTERIEPPGRIDGGDVLEIDDLFLVGLTERTDAEGAAQLCTILEREGFSCETVGVPAGLLHLKSGLSYLGGGIVLAERSCSDLEVLTGFDVITVAEGEDYCANSISVNGRIVFPAGFPRTRSRLMEAGFELVELDMSEFRKMDGGLSCLSLRMNL
jgi:dimethylargininase